MAIRLDVKETIKELQQAISELKVGNNVGAIINTESALSRIISHAHNQELVVAYVPNVNEQT